MNTIENDYGLTPDEIRDDQFRVEDGTATEFEGETWWAWDQFISIHCQHVGQSWRRLGRVEAAIERQCGVGVVGDMEMVNGRCRVCLPRWAALRYLSARKQTRQSVKKHRFRP